MKIIYSTWDARADNGRGRWRNKPAQEAGAMTMVCALQDHSKCTHGDHSVFTHVVALRTTRIQSVLLTAETCVIRLVPK